MPRSPYSARTWQETSCIRISSPPGIPLTAGWLVAYSIQSLVVETFRGLQDFRRATVYDTVLVDIAMATTIGALWVFGTREIGLLTILAIAGGITAARDHRRRSPATDPGSHDWRRRASRSRRDTRDRMAISLDQCCELFPIDGHRRADPRRLETTVTGRSVWGGHATRDPRSYPALDHPRGPAADDLGAPYARADEGAGADAPGRGDAGRGSLRSSSS